MYSKSFLIPSSVIDENGHVNNVAYVQWMQDIAVEHYESIGGVNSMQLIGATWVVREHKIKYFLPAFENEEIEIRTWVENVRRVRSLRKYEFVRKSDGRTLVEGETDWVFVDARSGLPRRFPVMCFKCSALIHNDNFVGRTPTYGPDPGGEAMKTYKSVKIVLAAIMLITSQLACQTLLPVPATATASVQMVTPTAVVPTSAATEFSDDEIKTGIQQSLDVYAEALTRNKPELLEQIVDQENKPFRRIVSSRFDEFQSSYLGGQVEFEFSVIDITRRDYGFVIAHFSTNSGLEAQWPFRYLNGIWVISEPSVEQLGPPITTETEYFTFTSYPWAEDVNPSIIALMETARGNVEKILGKVPAEKANVEIMPIYGLDPFSTMNAIASYSQGTTSTEDKIEIYTPNSFSYSFYDPSLGWDGELEQTLTHEYTHMSHARSFGGAGKLADWMSEGLAEYVAGAADDNSYWACDAMASGTVIPILDETKDIYKQDLMHMYGLEANFGLSYDFATSLVAFTVEEYGGLDGFWKLANTFDKTSDFKEAVQESFGISYDEYNTQWQAWLGTKC